MAKVRTKTFLRRAEKHHLISKAKREKCCYSDFSRWHCLIELDYEFKISLF